MKLDNRRPWFSLRDLAWGWKGKIGKATVIRQHGSFRCAMCHKFGWNPFTYHKRCHQILEEIIRKDFEEDPN